jgi:hypothetical protein
LVDTIRRNSSAFVSQITTTSRISAERYCEDLNIATYLDMALQGGPSSQARARSLERSFGTVDINL